MILNALRATPPRIGFRHESPPCRRSPTRPPGGGDYPVLPRKGVLDVRPRPAIARPPTPRSPVPAHRCRFSRLARISRAATYGNDVNFPVAHRGEDESEFHRLHRPQGVTLKNLLQAVARPALHDRRGPFVFPGVARSSMAGPWHGRPRSRGSLHGFTSWSKNIALGRMLLARQRFHKSVASRAEACPRIFCPRSVISANPLSANRQYRDLFGRCPLHPAPFERDKIQKVRYESRV